MTEFTEDDFAEIYEGLPKEWLEKWKQKPYAEKERLLRDKRRHDAITKFYYRSPDRRMLPEIHVKPTFCPGSAMGVHGHMSALLLAYAIIGALLNVSEWDKDSLDSIDIDYDGDGLRNKENLQFLPVHVRVKFKIYELPDSVKQSLGDALEVAVTTEVKHEHLPSADAVQLQEIAGEVREKVVAKVRDQIRKCRAKLDGTYKYEEEQMRKFETQFGSR